MHTIVVVVFGDIFGHLAAYCTNPTKFQKAYTEEICAVSKRESDQDRHTHTHNSQIA